MKLHEKKTSKQLCLSLADWICDYIGKVLQKRDRFTLCLSGGNSPRQLYELLAQSPFKEKIPWEKLHIFFGDERYVPFDDERNNGRMANETLLRHVAVPRKQIHFIHTTLPPETSAMVYEETLNQYFGGQKNSFDLVLLGMGTDGHTLSLFPHSEIIHEKKYWVKSFLHEEDDMFRITLTPPLINRAKRIAFLVTGKKKSPALKKVLKGKSDPEKFPAKIIKPGSGELHWFVDEGAASGQSK